MILITGATGFVGRNLIESMPKENIKCLVRSTSNIEFLKKYNVNIVYGDINDKKSLDNALKGIDAVIHLAAYIRGSNKDLFYKVNTEGIKNLIEACKKNKIKRIIMLSSMAVTRKYLDDYGKSKKQAEDLLKNSNLDYTILRPSMIYGKDSNSTKHLISYINMLPLIIPIVGNGKFNIQPIYINDVTSVIIKSLDNKTSIGKTYDLLGETRISFNYFIDFISSRLNIKKIKFHIPVSFVLIGISFFRFFYKNFPVTKEFIKGMGYDTIGDNSKVKQDLNVKFKKLSQSFQI